MSNIPSNLLPKLREALLSCAPVYSNNELRDVFKDQRITPWRFSVPSRDTPQARVDALIAFLSGKQRADTKENALVLFLQAARDLLNEQDEDYLTLDQAARDLGQALGNPMQTPTTTAPRYISTDSFTNYENGLRQLEAAIKDNPNAQQELSTFAQRLRENINRSRRYGDTSNRRAERAEIIDNLNTVSHAITQKSFDEWWRTS